MQPIKATDNIYYVGAGDEALRVFDIIMRTDYGTTYNAYLVKGSEKNVLFETVKDGFTDELLSKLDAALEGGKLDYIVMSHTEPDHSGSLLRILDAHKGAKVIATRGAIGFLGEIMNAPFDHIIANDGDTISLGNITLEFIITPMLHWPDTMFTYAREIKALFTCDCFGCHYADARIFNDCIEGDFLDAYEYYFTHILGPYKRPFLVNALKRIENLDIDFIGNGHGPVIRKNPMYYIDMYKRWCEAPDKKEPMVAVAYVSAYGYTRRLKDAVVEGLRQGGINDVRCFDLVECDMALAKAAIADADGIALGTPTILGDALPPVYEATLMLNPTIHKGKVAGVFGSYGWSGEGVPNIAQRLKTLKLCLVSDGLKVRFNPTPADIDEAKKLGAAIAANVLK